MLALILTLTLTLALTLTLTLTQPGDHESVVNGDKMRLYLHALYWALTTLTTVG